MSDKKAGEKKPGKVNLKALVKPWPAENKTQFGFEGVVRGEGGGCSFVSSSGLSVNREVVTHVVKQLGANVMEGKSIINISLPVSIFEPRSFLQRMCDHWSYAPLYLNKAAMSKSAEERFKWAVTFVISGLHQGCKQRKPFNPILGETFQATYPDGTRVFLEQISHHPPVSQFELFGPNGAWKMYGYNEYRASFRPNGVAGGQYGPNIIEFSDGTKIEYNMPKIYVSGLVMGTWLFYWTDTITFVDRKNGFSAEIKFDPDNSQSMLSYAQSFFASKAPVDTLVGSLKKDGKEIAKIDGTWLTKLRFGGKVYWKTRQFLPFVPAEIKEPLPSQATRRADLVALSKGDKDGAQKEKERLENVQRNDRKLRKKLGPKKPAH